MLRSMTGFGRAEQLIEGFNIKAQVKSVNHRYIDFTIRVPRYYGFLEDKVRCFALNYISRGKVDIYVSIEQTESDDRVITLNVPVTQGYIGAFKELVALGVKDDISASVIAQFSDIFKTEYKEVDEDKITGMVESVLKEAFSEFVVMREAEGERLKKVLLSGLTRITELIDEIEKYSPQSVVSYRSKMEARIKELIGNVEIDENRILTESAIFADKINVDEETVRLKSHVREFKKSLESTKPIGKKLDFIIQEMNREANTIGSKANDIEISKLVVDLKSEIEKNREQIQNIE